ncbi:hypothetical protein GCM10009758_07710 [Microbacterium hatanonis]
MPSLGGRAVPVFMLNRAVRVEPSPDRKVRRERSSTLLAGNGGASVQRPIDGRADGVMQWQMFPPEVARSAQGCLPSRSGPTTRLRPLVPHSGDKRSRLGNY